MGVAGASRIVPCDALPRHARPRTPPCLSGVESGPSPHLAGSSHGGLNTRAAGAFVTADTVPLTETPEVERTDPQPECVEMRPHFAGALGFAGMPEYVNQGVQLPPIGIADSCAYSARIESGEQFDGVAEFSKLPGFARTDRCVQ